MFLTEAGRVWGEISRSHVDTVCIQRLQDTQKDLSWAAGELDSGPERQHGVPDANEGVVRKPWKQPRKGGKLQEVLVLGQS